MIHELIFAAGFFEGDGTCLLNKGVPYVSITQKDRGILDWLVATLGGKVYTQAQYWQWQLGGAKARGFLQTIYATGFLSPRRRAQIEKTLGIYPRRNKSQERSGLQCSEGSKTSCTG